ncbi:hypothetical protein PsorP6_002591 [Peronosclerospora sorghi]|uniref:Uncharacterized protein n=1 Tax=Peronosclerospora sorghi TaxID=230839 RepID=A0ACC0WVN4_9STRA|nr:hypothetical protein PsorP6_002591 [Peronosclerospora sorghi]
MVETKKETNEISGESDSESDVEWHEDESERMAAPTDNVDKGVSNADISQAKFVLRNIKSRIPLIEETAIRRGVKLSGPPLEFATMHMDEYARYVTIVSAGFNGFMDYLLCDFRKFRWPQQIRNLKNTDFSQDPIEIFEDFELLRECDQPDQAEQSVSMESPFAQVPRPIVALAAGALRRSSQKRKRTCSENKELSSMFPSAHTLLGFARVGGQFSDHVVESLLTANGKALQGIEDDFECDMDKRCWSSLPTKKKPIANWRFVLEHVRRTMGRPQGFSNAVYPPMKQE